MPHRRPNLSSVRHHGFSFVELLFAVAIMGLGFIMIAAIFPVGLQQTKLTLDETAGAANARQAVASVQQIASNLVPVGAGVPPLTLANATSIMPATATIPTAMSAGYVPASSTQTIPGQVRSFRDARTFGTAAGNADPNTAMHNDAVWKRVADQIINPSDTRNASVVLFKRDWVVTKNAGGALTPAPTPASYAQVIVINAQVTNKSTYTLDDVINTATPPVPQALYNLEPRPVTVQIYLDTDGTYVAKVGAVGGMTQGFTSTPATAAATAAVVDGSFIVISDDQIKTPLADVGRMNGRIYRVGSQKYPLADSTIWQLAPGYDFSVDPGYDGKIGSGVGDDITAIGVKTTSADSNVDVYGPAVAFVLGRSFADPTVTPTAAAGYTGPAQDVAVYTTFVTVP